MRIEELERENKSLKGDDISLSYDLSSAEMIQTGSVKSLSFSVCRKAVLHLNWIDTFQLFHSHHMYAGVSFARCVGVLFLGCNV